MYQIDQNSDFWGLSPLPTYIVAPTTYITAQHTRITAPAHPQETTYLPLLFLYPIFFIISAPLELTPPLQFQTSYL